MAVSLAGFSGYAVLLTTAAQWALRGGSNAAGAGLVTFALLSATVAAQFAVPGWLRRFGHGPVVAAGLVLLGGPAPAYLLSDALAPILLVSAVRGIGFGILTVTGAAVIARLVPLSRRGEAIGLYGLSVAVPMVFVLPTSVLMLDAWGFAFVAVAGALPLLGVPAALAVAGHLSPEPDPSDSPDPAEAADPGEQSPTDHDPGAAGATSRGTVRHVVRPTLVLTAITMAGGALVTFVPEVTGGRVAMLALLAMGAVAALCRWRAGLYADAHGPQAFLVPLLVCGAAGMGLCAWAVSGGVAWLLLAGVTLAGVAYGALQSLTLLIAFASVPARAIPTASAAWNIGYDAGTAIGAALAGALATAYSFPVALSVLGALCLLAIVPARAAVPSRAASR